MTGDSEDSFEKDEPEERCRLVQNSSANEGFFWSGNQSSLLRGWNVRSLRKKNVYQPGGLRVGAD
jgi:hypothetical protein